MCVCVCVCVYVYVYMNIHDLETKCVIGYRHVCICIYEHT